MSKKKSLLSKILIVSLAVLLLLANTGISIRAHYCHGNLSQVIAYSEFGVSAKAKCNCADQDLSNDNSFNDNVEQIIKPKCCKNTYAFNKLKVESSLISFEKNIISPIPFAFLPELFIAQTIISDYSTLYSPPIVEHLSGRALILFLSQLLIPAFSI